MSTDREELPPRHMQPPERFLRLFGLEREAPEEVYCASCAQRNEGRGVYLFTRYGRFGIDMRNRGRWPDVSSSGAWRGQRRVEWMLCTAKACDLGHTTLVRSDGTLLHAGEGQEAPRVVRARECVRA